MLHQTSREEYGRSSRHARLNVELIIQGMKSEGRENQPLITCGVKKSWDTFSIPSRLLTSLNTAGKSCNTTRAPGDSLSILFLNATASCPLPPPTSTNSTSPGRAPSRIRSRKGNQESHRGSSPRTHVMRKLKLSSAFCGGGWACQKENASKEVPKAP